MDLETLIVAVFCLVDDVVRDLCRGRRLRQRGPAPVLADSEVLTVEIVGEFLGLDTDRGLHAHFRRHFGHLFPGLREVHRTTFLRQQRVEETRLQPPGSGSNLTTSIAASVAVATTRM